ncbi:D-Ala-D-Ala carboxypeptidase family metallohydrolase [Kordiimonas aestuarii]|uniref:D-Ala-D-Ala carboxypeptidase family metallohydrolase n=1 Tax=Kordiimonas aestuarii TaxID=1005925 RepID=UPI0021CF6A1D|nr:D-Ala-D-Ala carboxypeptidase family metallohydrolase [Kordiimonas aestuarii]
MTAGIHRHISMGGGFTLQDFTNSRVAQRYGLYNLPRDVSVVANLKALCERVLVPLQGRFGRRITVLSAYRTDTLNRLLGGVRQSAHIRGEAADILVTGVKPCDAALTISAMDDLPFDRLVHERRVLASGAVQTWLYVSHRRMDENRQQLHHAMTRDGIRHEASGLFAPGAGLAA